MSMRRHLVLVLAGIWGSMGASYRTTNFYVEAPTPQIAQQLGQAAEVYRRQKAMDWLGHEMPPWPEPCPLKATLTMGGAGGATSFAFDRGRVLGQHMNIEGSLDRLLASVLPHEVTHTVFAFHFRTPVPRWADEGGAVLSEDEVERNRHDMLCRQILNSSGRHIPLRRLFTLRDYPGDVMALYAEGFSVVNYLVNSSNRQTFLGFVGHGMQHGWDAAAQVYYRYNTVEELEQAWLAHLRATKRQPTMLAQNPNSRTAEPGNRVVVRQTAPPSQPSLPAVTPTFRGKSASIELEGEPVADTTRARPAARPGYLPDYIPSQASVAQPPAPPIFANQDRWQPSGAPTYAPPVQLGPPQYAPAPPPNYVQQNPGPGSPVGYPR